MNVTGIELGVSQAVDRALDDLQTRHRAWVVGQAGSGRTTLSRRLAEVLRDRGQQAAVVELLEVSEEDAPIGALYGAASALPSPEARKRCFRDWPSLSDGVEQLAKEAPKGFTVVVLVHNSWEGAAVGDEDDWSACARRRGAEFLRALAGNKEIDVAWITSRNAKPDPFDANGVTATPLPAPKNARALFKTANWGSYTPHAQALDNALPESVDPSPLVLRLAVGLVALGGDVTQVGGFLSSSTSAALSEVLREMSERLSQPALSPCREAVARLLLARRPLPASKILGLTDVPLEHLPLLTHCLGYGDKWIKVSSSIRSTAFGRTLTTSADTEANHLALATHFTALDGAASVADTSELTTAAWMEKHHHLARTTHEAVLPELPCRELFWSRARYLSIVRKDWERAASVYAECTRRFPDDSYGWHYFAFNLERAGKERDRVEAAYVKAISLDRSNPWWNSRRVTFLLGQGRPRSAKEAWLEALQNVDPDGERILTERSLPEHLHNWVARAWLDAGNASEAFAVLRSIPKEAFASDRLGRLRQVVLDAVEADAIGESVYPRWYPVDQRWKAPSRLLDRDEVTLERWFRGRILRADDKGVRIVYATRLANGRYESSVNDVDHSTWKATGFGTASRASGFVELGVYDDGSRKIVPVDDLDNPDPDSRTLTLAYFDRWRSRR